MNRHITSIINNYISLKLPFERELLETTRHLIVLAGWDRGDITRIIYSDRKWRIATRHVWPDNWSNMDKKRLHADDFSRK